MLVRIPKPTDQIYTQKAYEILIKIINETMEKNPEIEKTLWAGAMLSMIVDGYIHSNISYSDFCMELEGLKRFYKNDFKN